MIRGFAYLLALSVATGLAIWLARAPGGVSLSFGAWRVDTTIGMFLVLLAVGGAVVYLLIRLAVWLLSRPRARSRIDPGEKALRDGWIALAQGDGGAALKLAGKARRSLADPILPELLAAQAAALAGDEAAARQSLAILARHPPAAAVGWRGLVEQALRQGDLDEVRRRVLRARKDAPADPWLLGTLLRLELTRQDWAAADEALTLAQRHRAIGPGPGRAIQAPLATARALAARTDQERADHAQRALLADPGFAPAAVLAAQALGPTNPKPALKLLEAAWKARPSLDLVAPYLALQPVERPEDRVRQIERLVAGAATTTEARLAVAEVALDAHLWGVAQGRLAPLLAERPRDRRALRLAARLAREETGDAAAAADLLAEAERLPMPPGWRCTACGMAHAAWLPVCGACAAPLAVAWSQDPAPARITALPGATVTPPLAAITRAWE